MHVAAVLGIVAAVLAPQGPSDGEMEHLTIRVGDFSFDAVATGPDERELVLLLHGFPQTGHAFRHQLHSLGAAGYRAVAPDQRGYSPGARPLTPDAYATNHLVADVIGMVDALGRERFHLVGHDWGGAVAWIVAARYPNRVLSLTVLSTPHYAAFSAGRADRGSEQSRRSSYFDDFAAPGAEDRFLEHDMAFFRSIFAGLRIPAADLQVYLDRLGTPEAMRAALNWYTALVAPPATGNAAPVSAGPRNVSPIRVPTLYMWGTADGAFARSAAEGTGNYVSAPYSFHVFEGAGHWLPEAEAEEVSRLLVRHVRGLTPDDM